MRQFFLSLCSIAMSLSLGSFALEAKTSSSPPIEDKNWEVLNEEKGITLYQSRISRKDIFTFRGTGQVRASIPKIIALISDPALLPQWVYNCEQGQLIERNFKETDRKADASDYYQIFYGVTSVPWPLKSRDYVLKAQVKYRGIAGSKKPEVTISMRDVEHGLKPVVEDFVRMPVMESTIVMTPEGPNGENTLVDFSVTSDPGGVIPAWVTKIASRDIPRKTLLSLQELVKRTEYNKKYEELVRFHYDQFVP